MTQLRVQSLVAAACATILVTLAGCATPPKPTPPVDEAGVALEESLNKVEKIPTYGKSADAKAPDAKLSGGTISIRSYQNEAAKLLSRVAAARGLKFAVRGPEPRLPLFVSVDVENVSFEEFLNEVGLQFGQRADIVLTNDAIEIRYRGM